MLKLKVPWHRITLYAAGDQRLTSRWSGTSIGGEAIESLDGKDARSAEITLEHVSALAELRDQDSCANWFTDASRGGSGPRREDIDWTGFDPGTATE